jgi:sec-independent protein translocase protein TatB
MFEIAWSELLLVAIVAILVVGPKELPGMLRTLGRMLGKLRVTAGEFRRQFDEAVREAGAEDLQREFNALRNNNPMTQLRDTLEDAAREPPLSLTPPAQYQPPADAVAGDDLGPPPPLPPKSAAPAPQGETAPPDAAPREPRPATAPKTADADDDGGHEIRLNGEHRTLN